MEMTKEQLKAIISEEAKKLGLDKKVELSLEEAAEKKRLNEEMYKEVNFRLDRLKKLTTMSAPSFILANELRMLGEEYSKIHPNIKFELQDMSDGN